MPTPERIVRYSGASRAVRYRLLRARIGASTRLWASGTWSIDHPEAYPAPPGGGTAVHSLILSHMPTPERIVRYVAARGAAEGTTRFGAVLGGAKF